MQELDIRYALAKQLNNEDTLIIKTEYRELVLDGDIARKANKAIRRLLNMELTKLEKKRTKA